MEKLQLDLPVLLPDLPDEKDQCVRRLIDLLAERTGIDKVHIRSEESDDSITDHTAQLCIHYNPQVISLNRVQTLAQQAGAEITHRYGHYVGHLNGIRHARHARAVTEQIRDWQGVLEASVSASGAVHLEFDQQKTSLPTLLNHLKQNDTPVETSQKNTVANHEHAHDHDHDHSHEGHTHDHAESHTHSHNEHAGHSHSSADGHNHDHGGIFGPNTELIFAILCAISLSIGFGPFLRSKSTELGKLRVLWISVLSRGIFYGERSR